MFRDSLWTFLTWLFAGHSHPTSRKAQPWTPELFILCFLWDLSLLYRFTMNLFIFYKSLSVQSEILQSLWIFTTNYNKIMRNYSFSNYSKLADLSKTIRVEGKLLDITEMDPSGGDIWCSALQQLWQWVGLLLVGW